MVHWWHTTFACNDNKTKILRFLGTQIFWCELSAIVIRGWRCVDVSAVSTSPSGGNQVDGSPPAASKWIVEKVPRRVILLVSGDNLLKKRAGQIYNLCIEKCLVEKVPHEVIRYAPDAILHQKWIKHRWAHATIKWLVEKVPRRVILYAPRLILHQRWAEHRYKFATVKFEYLS